MPEEKTRIHTRITPETERKMAAAMPAANCQSQNEFVETAICFYCDYLAADDTLDFISPNLSKALRATVQDSENRMARMLFKLTVETSMMMNVLAAGMEISEADLEYLRGRCIREIKKTNGNISLKDAVKYQRGD